MFPRLRFCGRGTSQMNQNGQFSALALHAGDGSADMDEHVLSSDLQDDQHEHLWQEQADSDEIMTSSHSETSGDSEDMEKFLPSDDPDDLSDYYFDDSDEASELQSDPATETEEGEPSDSSSDADDPIPLPEDSQPDTEELQSQPSEDCGHAHDPKSSKAKEKGDHWLYDGCSFTVLMAVYALVKVKLETNMTTVSFDAILRIFNCLLPEGNQLPTSFFRCKSILMVKDLAIFLWDCCPCGKWSWDPVDPRHEDDHCPFCKSRRFHPRIGHGKLVPVQVCPHTPG